MVIKTIRELPLDTKLFFQRMMVMPFEAAIALTAILGGILGFTDTTYAAKVFNDALSIEEALTFNLFYILAGFSIFAGLGWAYRNLEACGLLLLFMSLIVRFVALFATVGVTTFTTGTLLQAIILGFASLVRLYLLIKKKTIVLLEPPPEEQNIIVENKNG